MASKSDSASERPRAGPALGSAVAAIPGIRREALLARVASATSARLVLVQAPAGYGKSTLLRQIAADKEARGEQVAWVGLGAADADVSRFLALVGHACHRLQDLAGIDSALIVRADPAARLATIAERVCLIIDDFDSVLNLEVAAALRRLVAQLPPGKQVVLASRADSGLAGGRMQLAGETVSLGSIDLRFDLAETFQFLASDARIGLDEVRQLHAQTGGWPAALQFLSLALARGHGRPAAALRTGITPALIDYLAEDVFDAQSCEVQSALLAICLPERVNGALVGELCGTERGGELLSGLVQAGLLLDPVDNDRNWFRFHAVFRHFLIARLRAREQPSAISATHGRIAVWLACDGAVDAAIGHQIAAGDEAAAVGLLEKVAGALVREERLGFIVSLVEQLAPERVHASPAILHAAIIAYGFRRQFEQAHTLLGFRERELAAGEPAAAQLAELEGLRVFVLAAEDKVERFGATARDVLALAVATDAFTYGVALNAYSFLLIAQSQYQEAHDHLLQAAPLHEHAHNHFGRSYQAAIFGTLLIAQGRITEASSVLGRALREAESDAPPGSIAGAIIAAFLGETLYEQGEVDEAERLLNAYLPLIEQQCIVDGLSVALVTLARIAGFRQRPQLQHELVDRLIMLGHRHHLERLVANGRAELVRLATQVGDEAVAAGWLASLEGAPEPIASGLYFHSGELETQRVARIRQMMQARRFAAARAALQAEIHAATLKRRARRLIRLHGLLAQCLDKEGDAAAARRALLQALRAGHAGGFRRIFLDEGAPMMRLLLDLSEHSFASVPRWTEDPLADYVATLTQANGRRPPPAQALQHPLAALTPRERDMLAFVGGGLSNQNLAARFAVSPNTIKWHLKNIYEKLGIRNRMQAVNAARRFGLIE